MLTLWEWGGALWRLWWGGVCYTPTDFNIFGSFKVKSRTVELYLQTSQLVNNDFLLAQVLSNKNPNERPKTVH